MPSVLELADERWKTVLAEQPDLEAAIALQRTLIARLIDATQRLDTSVLPDVADEYVADKLRRGTPFLRGERIAFPVSFLAPLLERFCEDLDAGGAGAPARHIRDALRSRQIEGASLVAASLARDEYAVRTSSLQLGLAPDLVWLVGELAAGPFANAVQRRFLQGADAADDPASAVASRRTGPQPLRAALEAWNRGYCPNCGSWPVLAELAGETRVFRCSFCAAPWHKRSNGCVYCDEEGVAFTRFAPDTERPDRRLELCDSCGGYLKTVRLTAPTEFPLIAIEDLATTHLDRVAMARGYRRPPLPVIDRRR